MSSVAPSLEPEPGLISPETARSIVPTLFGEGYGLYQTRKSTVVLSFLGHGLVLLLLCVSSRYLVTHRHEIRRQVMDVITDVSPYTLPPSQSQAGGGGGGGDRDKLAASKGALPKLAREQITPPAAVVRNEEVNNLWTVDGELLNGFSRERARSSGSGLICLRTDKGV